MACGNWAQRAAMLVIEIIEIIEIHGIPASSGELVPFAARPI
ncbi:hypothetical protein ACI2LO_00080 [Streptomyces sp. NPDC033754]